MNIYDYYVVFKLKEEKDIRCFRKELLNGHIETRINGLSSL